MRGEYDGTCQTRSGELGSPPLARGVLLSRKVFAFLIRITPACAGSTKINEIEILNGGDHPRLRGEYEKKH